MSIERQDRKSRRPDSLRGESGLVQRVRRFLRESFPDRSPHLVVGYSGGRDSLALLLVLRELQRLGSCRVTAVHVDHRLRPDASEAAARALVVAKSLGVTCVLVTADSDLREQASGQGIEDVARRFRYRSLARVLDEVDGDAVAVGHHQRDQAETVLLHVLRGSGLAGLRGMEADGTLVLDGPDPVVEIRVIRPFLHEAPESLEDVVRDSGVPVIEDPTNDTPDFRRNRIRHEVLPLLEEISPGSVGRLVALADIVRADDEALDDVAHALMHRTTDERGRLGWQSVRNAPLGLQRRVVRHWVHHAGYTGDPGLERVDAVVALANRGVGGRRVEIGGGWSVGYRSGLLGMQPPEGTS